jgi:serine/threonine protein kinase
VALKIQRSKDTHTESAIDELQMLTEIQRHEQDPEWLEFLSQMEAQHSAQINVKLCRPLLLLDNFPHYGIHGKHMCSVFELMGPNLLDVIQHYEYKDKRMPLWLVKKITRDTLLGLVYLHERCRIIHTDLKPENIMIKMEAYEEQQLIEQLKNYKIKPLSMKYLKNLQAAKNPKNKKKQEKKKLKKKKAQEQGEKKEGEDEVEGEEPESSSSIPEAKVE